MLPIPREPLTASTHLMTAERDTPIRVSAGSALTLGLAQGSIQVKPTTLYLLTYRPEKCLANCLFCPQAKTSQSRPDLLSRVNWPLFSLRDTIDALMRSKDQFGRICLQAMNYAGVAKDIAFIASQILSKTEMDISVSCQPLDAENLERLRDVGVDRVGISLDAATPELFAKVKGKTAGGPYTWQGHMKALREALSVFGPGRVTTHLIVGLGETDQEMIELVEELLKLGVYPALFTFTPIQGTPLENQAPPTLLRYRLIQTARYLLVNKLARLEDLRFSASGALVGLGVAREELHRLIETGLPYLTSGCPSCNRPFYNEKPSGPIYNYPHPMTFPEIEEAKRILEGYHLG